MGIAGATQDDELTLKLNNIRYFNPHLAVDKRRGQRKMQPVSNGKVISFPGDQSPASSFEKRCFVILKFLGIIRAGDSHHFQFKVPSLADPKQKFQADIWVERSLECGGPETIFIECKYHSRRVKRADVQKLADSRQAVGANRALLISKSGFTKEALAHASLRGIECIQLDAPEDPAGFYEWLHCNCFTVRRSKSDTSSALTTIIASQGDAGKIVLFACLHIENDLPIRDNSLDGSLPIEERIQSVSILSNPHVKPYNIKFPTSRPDTPASEPSCSCDNIIDGAATTEPLHSKWYSPYGGNLTPYFVVPCTTSGNKIANGTYPAILPN